ncbi:hypothetical protein F5884DRAFT_762034 [Xylogone sp. PMI_703]|nr:hypothetical protein F5884DRAFT_762034 [Xylogone sp. PMI_703]
MATIDLDPSINPSQSVSVPPNFPSPIPVSWVAFAAPQSHITTYPETSSGYKLGAANPGYKPDHLLVDKRLELDFSHQGIPLFEFSSMNIFTASKVFPFLAANIPLPPFDEENDTYMPYTDDEYEEILSRWEESEDFAKRGRPIDEPFELPCPNQGEWWSAFHKELSADCRTWEKIKAAMGRGKCRVVCQWVERQELNNRDGEGHNNGRDHNKRGGHRGGRGGFRGRGYMGRGRGFNNRGGRSQMNPRPHSNLSQSF